MNPKNYKLNATDREWKGLTLNEIRYARAILGARIDISREILSANASAIFSGKGATSSSSLLGRMLGALNWVDYSLIALRVGQRAVQIFRRRK